MDLAQIMMLNSMNWRKFIPFPHLGWQTSVCSAACWTCAPTAWRHRRRLTLGAVLQHSWGLCVMFHRQRTTLRKPRHSKCPKGNWMSSFPSRSYSSSYLPVERWVAQTSIQLPRSEWDSFPSLYFSHGFLFLPTCKARKGLSTSPAGPLERWLLALSLGHHQNDRI